MPFRGIGYNITDYGSPEILDEGLRVLIDAGYQYAEIGPHNWEAWIDGRLSPSQFVRFSRVLERHRDKIAYTMHGPMDVNLFDVGDSDAHVKLLTSAIETAIAINAETYVYHPGERIDTAANHRLSMSDLESRERQILLDMADWFGASGGKIAIETMATLGVPGYTYANWPEQLITQVQAIDHPAIGVCIDFGHLYSAARWYGFNFEDNLFDLAPFAVHLHVQDLAGVRMQGDSVSVGLGLGDLHLPAGRGSIPYEEIFHNYDFPLSPVFINEVRGPYLPFATEILETSRKLIEINELEPVAAYGY